MDSSENAQAIFQGSIGHLPNQRNLTPWQATGERDALGVTRSAMALQTGFDKKTVLNFRPAFLNVPAALELKAEQLDAKKLLPANSTKVVPQSIRNPRPDQ